MILQKHLLYRVAVGKQAFQSEGTVFKTGKAVIFEITVKVKAVVGNEADREGAKLFVRGVSV